MVQFVFFHQFLQPVFDLHNVSLIEFQCLYFLHSKIVQFYLIDDFNEKTDNHAKVNDLLLVASVVYGILYHSFNLSILSAQILEFLDGSFPTKLKLGNVFSSLLYMRLEPSLH